MTDELFAAEDAVIDRYVEAKDSGQGDPLIENLIMNFFLPQQRFEEAKMWVKEIRDTETLARCAAATAKAAKTRAIPEIFRMPVNTSWTRRNPFEPARESQSAQYFYDRIISYCNTTHELEKDIDDIKTCANEWVTFVMKNAYKGMKDLGATKDVIAMGLRDYIEQILIPNAFVETEFSRQGELQVDSDKGEESDDPFEGLSTVKEAYRNTSEALDYFQKNCPWILDQKYFTNFYASESPTGGDEEIIVTDQRILFAPSRKSGWFTQSCFSIALAALDHIEVGSEVHTEYQGLTSTTSSFWTLTFVTTNYENYIRYLYLGKNESEMNRNRGNLVRVIQDLGDIIQLVEGDSYTSSGGYQTSIGFGVWNSF